MKTEVEILAIIDDEIVRAEAELKLCRYNIDGSLKIQLPDLKVQDWWTSKIAILENLKQRILEKA